VRKIVIIAGLILSSCDRSADIQDDVINDRVKACSAGFSNETTLALRSSLNKLALSGYFAGEFKHDTRSAIFSEIPELDRVKAYEDYISCIEKNWNSQAKK